MAVFKCKMCGGDLEINEGATIAECEYCGTKQTVPKSGDENLQNLFNRANTLRIKSEFDKAEKLYEKIIQADSTQAEAYWGLILCKNGIEYVDDPATFKKIPTCHRASYDSVVADDDYKAALNNADAVQREIYEQQAKEIDRIQKEILTLAQKQESYDVFICYKETDASGKRTQDSVIANDIYYQLQNAGFKVFYAAITLEGKLGQDYEPIIFAALNSAKVMLVLGTKSEFFNAVWVKNEWSRFLKIIKKDRSKMLIPCYRDMDAYELPEEFAHLQAQDMGKIGFINDIVRGIKKVVKGGSEKSAVQETVSTNEPLTANVTALLERGFMALEDSEWEKADDFFEQCLNQNAKLAEAYLGKLMAELQVKTKDALKDCAKPFEDKSNYQKTVRFAGTSLKDELTSYIDHIKTRNENERMEGIYRNAKANMDGDLISRYEYAIELLKSIPGWKDADEVVVVCQNKIEEIKVQLEKENAEKERKRIEKEKQDAIRLVKIKKIATLAIVGILAITLLLMSLNFNAMVNIVDISCSKHTVGLKKNGTVIAIGQNTSRQCDVKTWTDIVAISAGEYHTVGLKKDGTVVAIGYNYYAQCNVETWTDITAVSAGGNHTVGLKKDGTVVAGGIAAHGQCDVSKWTDMIAVSAGGYHTVGLKKDGTVVAVGRNAEGQCNVSKWTDIVAVSAGHYHTVGLKSDGTVLAIGYNFNGECDVKAWTDIVAISAGEHHTVGLKSDGTVIAIGQNTSRQCDVENWRNIVAISAGENHTVGLKKGGRVVATGTNNYGQCDVGRWRNPFKR